MLKEARLRHEAAPDSMSRARNPLALSLDGDSLETVAAISVIHSTHVVPALGANSRFDGRTGIFFMYNLVQNLIEHGRHRIDTGFSLSCECESARLLLENAIIPFLVPYNFKSNDISPVLSNLITQNAINVGTFTRTANATCIDGEFKFTLSTVSKNATVDCKNWATVLDSVELTCILVKAVSKDSCMSLIFCNRTVNNLRPVSALRSYCQSRSIKLLRIVRHKELCD